jgi:uncharacterized protein YuzE
MKLLDMTIDRDLDLAYLYIGDGEIAETISINNSINVDLGTNGDVFGVEFLSFSNLSQSEKSLKADFPEATTEIVEAVLFSQERLKSSLTSIR